MTIKHWIEQLDVDGVHLVGDPANRRPFAIVKNLAGRRPADPPTGDGAMKKAELIEKLKAGEKAEITAAELVELVGRDMVIKAITAGEGGRDVLLKALGVDPASLTKQDPPKDDETTFAQRVMAAIAKAFGKPEPAAASREAMLKALPPEARAYVEALEATVGSMGQKVDQVVKARADEATAAIRKRAQDLKDRGVELEVEKATAEQVAAHEAAQAQIDKAFEDLGITRARGSSKPGEGGERSVRAEVHKEVVRRLGREPLNKAEAAQIRRQIYSSMPGLLDAVRREEQEERAERTAAR